MTTIEQIRPELTWRLRKEVLYPDEPLYAMEMEEDHHGYHFGAFQNDQLVAVVSLFQKESSYQFRKFAVRLSHQHQGIGTQLLNYIADFAKTGGATRLWCNARLSAVEFYHKQRFATEGDTFEKNGIGYIIMAKAIS